MGQVENDRTGGGLDRLLPDLLASPEIEGYQVIILPEFRCGDAVVLDVGDKIVFAFVASCRAPPIR